MNTIKYAILAFFDYYFICFKAYIVCLNNYLINIYIVYTNNNHVTILARKQNNYTHTNICLLAIAFKLCVCVCMYFMLFLLFFKDQLKLLKFFFIFFLKIIF